ncbi:MAG: toxin-antitoxin (TA) system antitoxin [bacterium]|nr:toxin-antitoxin (TA) system antitoxin [bacterium]
MTTKTIDIQTTHISVEELVSLVADGTEVLLTNGDELLARLSPVEKVEQPTPGKRIFGLFPGVWMSDDFDEPLSDEFWLGESDI